MEDNEIAFDELNLLSPEVKGIVAELDEFQLEMVLHFGADEFGGEEIYVFQSPIPEGEKAELRRLIIKAYEAGAGVEKRPTCGVPDCLLHPLVFVPRKRPYPPEG